MESRNSTCRSLLAKLLILGAYVTILFLVALGEGVI